MMKPSASIRKLARQLMAAEASRRREGDGPEAVLVLEKLREALTRLAGEEGFTALLRRSLALARADVPALGNATVSADGCIEGLEDTSTRKGKAADAGTELTVHFLWLLVTFVGEPIAIRLVRDAWPDETIDD